MVVPLQEYKEIFLGPDLTDEERAELEKLAQDEISFHVHLKFVVRKKTQEERGEDGGSEEEGGEGSRKEEEVRVGSKPGEDGRQSRESGTGNIDYGDVYI